jgi:hypothetical protein
LFPLSNLKREEETHFSWQLSGKSELREVKQVRTSIGHIVSCSYSRHMILARDEMKISKPAKMLMRGLLLGLIALSSSSEAPTKLTEDGLVQKTIIRQGREGQKPRPGDTVHVHYVGRFLDGKLFDSSRDRGQPYSFVVGRGVISGWSVAVESMNIGELAEVTIDYEYGYGERGYPPVVPAKSKLIFEFELVSIGEA